MPGRRRFLGQLAALPLLLGGCQPNPGRPALQVGQPLPAIALRSLDGRSMSFSPSGGPYLLNFWATWCPPCRAEMAALDRVHRALAGRGLKVLGISVDTDRYLVDEYLRRARLSFPMALDVGGAMARRLQVTAYPTTVLVDAAGWVANLWLGEKDWDAPAIRAILERQL
ncbi:MAG: Peroxiredoxin [Proteobacteria bacterium]|nr:Peroxiredoxin [Pseudomonadota bacterium]